MIKTPSTIKNEKGAMMILITVMLLVLLTVISIAASRTSNTEIKIAANDYVHQRCFYNAEGAIMEVVDQLATTINPKNALPTWMASGDAVINDTTVFTYWDDDSGTRTTIPQGATVDAKDTGFMSVHHGVLAGDTLDMTKPSKHTFSIYGRCENKGMVILKAGYTGVYK